MSRSPILIIAGTNRPGSNAMRLAKLVESKYAVAGVPTDFYSLAELRAALFDASAYATKPAGWSAVQDRVLAAGGLHLVVPEYNGSFPGVLKYFIDMLKFPESFELKPVAFVGEAAGVWGALRAVEQLQMIFSYRNAHLFQDRVFIPGVNQKFDSDGRFIDAAIDQRLTKQAAGFADFVARQGGK